MAAVQQDTDFQLRVKAKFAELLPAGNPVARLIDDFGKWLKSNNKKYVSRKGVTVKEFLLMHLLDGVWLDGEILCLYAELLVPEDARFQVIPAHTIDWELRTLNKPEGPNADTWANYDIDGQATTFLIPTLVNTNHWMLCIGKISDVNNKSGILDCYNSLASFSQACQSAANDVIRVLSWFGEIPGSPLQGVTWTVNQCISGTQKNFDDCGVFVCANTAAVVLATPIPQNVDGFRLQIASQLVKAPRDETLDWNDVKNMLAAAGMQVGQCASVYGQDDDAGDGEVDENKDVDIDEAEDDCEVMMETDHRCDICWYHYAPTAKSLATHKRKRRGYHQDALSRGAQSLQLL